MEGKGREGKGSFWVENRNGIGERSTKDKS